MKQRVKLILVLLQLFLVPVFLFFWLNLQVSHKYEVNHARTFVDINDDLTFLEKDKLHNEINTLEQSINLHSWWMLGLAAASFMGAITVALLPSKKIRD